MDLPQLCAAPRRRRSAFELKKEAKPLRPLFPRRTRVQVDSQTKLYYFLSLNQDRSGFCMAWWTVAMQLACRMCVFESGIFQSTCAQQYFHQHLGGKSSELPSNVGGPSRTEPRTSLSLPICQSTFRSSGRTRTTAAERDPDIMFTSSEVA